MPSTPPRPFDPLSAVPPPDDLPDALPRRRVWPWLVARLGLLAAVGVFAYRVATAPDEKKVLLWVDLDGKWWDGSTAAAALADSLAARLTEMGFVVVRSGDPEVTEILETTPDARKAGDRLRAAWVIEADFSVAAAELPIDGGFHELRAEGPVRVLHPDTPPAVSAVVSSWSGAKTRDKAAGRLGEALADRVFDAALPLLVEHPRLRAVFQAGVSSTDSVLADTLRAAREYVEQRKQTLTAATKRYEEAAERHERAERGPAPVRYHSDVAARDGLCGVGPLGPLVKSADEPLFFAPERRTLARLSALESVGWLGSDGKRRPLWSGYNLYSYPTLAPGATGAVLVEDLFGLAKTVTYVAADGTATRLRVDPTHRYSGGRVSPGGRFVAVQDRACRECPEGLLVLGMGGEAPDAGIDLPPEDGAFSGWTWLDANRLAVLYTPGKSQRTDALFSPVRPTPGEGARSTLYAVDFSAVPPKAAPLWSAEKDEHLSWLTATDDAKVLAFEIDGPGDDAFGVFDVASGQVTRLRAPGGSAPSLSPDGRTVAFQQIDPGQGDEEVAVVSVGDAEPRRLTDNPHRDRYPQFDPAGTRIYFESLSDDPNFKGRQTLSRIASVPFVAAGPAKTPE
jgi:hypothetical protein